MSDKSLLTPILNKSVKSSVTKKRIRKMQLNWNPELTQKFIMEVKIREGMWNIFSKDYKDRNIREALWQEVVDIMGLPRIEVSSKWNSLRCSFRAAFNKMSRKKNGKVSAPNSVYKSLKFLEPTLQISAPTASNLINKTVKSDTKAYLELDDTESEPSTSTPLPKQRRIEKDDNEVTKVIKRGLETTTAAAKNDIWDVLGNCVTSNSREWAEEDLQLAREFKSDVYELISNYQKRFNTHRSGDFD
ncbi:uncharacterized protein LOC119685264 [Teleopsis dalmanni]|uniref:uncharacterized protein LOC119685264 n=1 Tax=Teleopsis dalmanni TaxID=139649 RepID=UPI000D32B5C6|nr:uncharacterized protein LOC119685264 [Teleopsis dalmanni]